jgi:hypothetical protein
MKTVLSMAIVVSIFAFFATTALAQQIAAPSSLLTTLD